jgi:hypothetical protein
VAVEHELCERGYDATSYEDELYLGAYVIRAREYDDERVLEWALVHEDDRDRAIATAERTQAIVEMLITVADVRR